jgi:hypothetical protein
MMERGGNDSLPRSRAPWRIHILVLLAYTLLALALTWPLAVHLGSHVPGNGVDDPPLTWNLWWVKYTLLNQGANPFDCDSLFYPLGINLAFYTLTVLNGLLSVPLQATLGLIPASNLLLLSSFVLSGYGTFLLSGYLLAASSKQPFGCAQDRQAASKKLADWNLLLAAFISGLLYAFSSSKLFYAALGQWNIASSQWIPFYVLYLFRMGEQPRRWRYALLAALFLLFQAYAEMTYASFLVLFTALWAVWQVGKRLRPGDRANLGRIVVNLGLVGLLVVIGLAPMLAAMLPDLRAEGNIFAEGGGFADVFSADLLGYLVPTMLHPLFGSLVEHFQFDHTVGQHLYLGYAALALALLGLVVAWRRPAVKFWVLSALIFWLLTLGPTLRVNGHDTGLPLPFALVARLPFFQGNRYPSRYSVMLVLSLAVLVAYGVKWLLERVASCKLHVASSSPLRHNLLLATCYLLLATCYLLLATCLLFEHLSIPLPLSDLRVPPVYETLAALPGDWTLLDLPVAWRNGSRVTGTLDPIIMFEQYYQTVHHKRLLAGNTSRNPPLKFQYFTEAPVLNSLIALETGHSLDPAVVEQDRALAAGVLRFFNIQAVVVHPAQTGPEVAPYVETVMPVERLYADDATVAYRVDLPPWPEKWTVEPGDELGRLSYAEGWGAPGAGIIWAQRRAVRLLLPANGQAQRLTFRAYAPGDGQRLRVEINGAQLPWLDLVPGWSDYELDLPASAVREGLNEVWLHFATLYPAEQVRLSPRPIGATGVAAPLNLVVQSAGQEVGDFAHIFADGVDVAPNERGYNVAVFHPATGELVATAAFDTHLDPSGASGQGENASQALAAFLDGVPPGYLVAVAAADEASRMLGPEAVEALRSIGAAGDLRGKFRWGHAIVGVKGVPPGSALEALDWMRPVSLVVGEGATEPHLAAAFATISLTAIPAAP